MPNSNASQDVLTRDGEHLQVKGRVVTADNPSRERSAIRSWDFDALVIVLFDDDFRLWQAAKVPMDIVREDAS